MSDNASNGTHSYLDWQISTLMLAHDVQQPLSRDDHAAQEKRQRQCELEARDIALSVIPPDFQSDPSKDFPPRLVMEMTKATLARAAILAGIADE